MARSDAFIYVECDTTDCKEQVEINLTALAGRGNWDERNVESQLRHMGWKTEDGNDICDACAEAMAQEGE